RAPIAVAGDGFLSVNPGVSGRFPSLSAPNIAAPFSGNTVAFDIVAPAAQGGATSQPALTRGFGAVFLNVRIPNVTSIEYLSGDTVVGRAFAPAGGEGQPSFVGELFASPVVTSVVVTLGTAQILSFDGTNFAPGVESSETVSNNLVAMDDLALAEPAPEAPPVKGTVGAAVQATASFSDADPNSNASHFTASIDWGDGSRGLAQVGAIPSGGFAATGGHTYAASGTYAVAITAQDLGGARLTFHTTATIAAAVPTPTPPPSAAPHASAPRCSLTVPSHALTGIGLATTKGKHHRLGPTVWRLGSIARCDQAATALVTAVTLLRPARKAHAARGGVKPEGFSLGRVRANLSANASTRLALKITAQGLAKLRSGLARHEHPSVTLSLAATNGNGTGEAFADLTITKLR
ncbi:MAG TPA: hypothetical protein VK672_03745, partial [Solirubrobacteraceae bacterium]|nr:hypothetical protein [Solirubrobacteraceae bacterium]